MLVIIQVSQKYYDDSKKICFGKMKDESLLD